MRGAEKKKWSDSEDGAGGGRRAAAGPAGRWDDARDAAAADIRNREATEVGRACSETTHETPPATGPALQPGGAAWPLPAAVPAAAAVVLSLCRRDTILQYTMMIFL